MDSTAFIAARVNYGCIKREDGGHGGVMFHDDWFIGSKRCCQEIGVWQNHEFKSLERYKAVRMMVMANSLIDVINVESRE